MSLSIAVCEDDKKANAALEKSLEDIFIKLNIKYDIEIYYSGEALCKKLEAGRNYNLIFLDIEYGESQINGVDVGRLIRETHQNNSVAIVYISLERKYSLALHDLQPLNFLIKPLKHEDIERVVTQYMKLAGIWSSYFTYKYNYETFRIQIKDIAYVESRGRKLIIHLGDGEPVEIYGSLKKAYDEQLQKYDFIFIHASFIINYDYIVKYGYETVQMQDGVELSVAQSKRADVRKRFTYIAVRREG